MKNERVISIESVFSKNWMRSSKGVLISLTEGEQKVKDFLFGCLTEEQHYLILDSLYNKDLAVKAPYIVVKDGKENTLGEKTELGYDFFKTEISFSAGIATREGVRNIMGTNQ